MRVCVCVSAAAAAAGRAGVGARPAVRGAYHFFVCSQCIFSWGCVSKEPTSQYVGKFFVKSKDEMRNEVGMALAYTRANQVRSPNPTYSLAHFTKGFCRRVNIVVHMLCIG